MSLRAFYESTGVPYDAFLQRMNGKEALIEKYLRIFLTDPTYAELSRAVAAEDVEAVGIQAHTLKGIALNLNLEKLSALCTNMVSCARSGDMGELVSLFEQMASEYALITKNLGAEGLSP